MTNTGGEDEGVTLSPDAPIGEPMPDSGDGAPPPLSVPGDDGVIGPGPPPESR